jgi:DNA-binding transcriptional ArsR family regulator
MPEGDPATTDSVFDALADETRRNVLQEIAQRGPLTATQLAEDFPVTRQAVSKHLSSLRSAGLVVATREGREVRYSFSSGALSEAAGWIESLAHWDRRLDRLEQRLADDSE